MTGFSTNINRVCGVQTFVIDKVTKTASNTDFTALEVAALFSIDKTGKFTYLDVSNIIEISKVYATATTYGSIASPSLHILNI